MASGAEGYRFEPCRSAMKRPGSAAGGRPGTLGTAFACKREGLPVGGIKVGGFHEADDEVATRYHTE
jgi:hypothetical protein